MPILQMRQLRVWLEAPQPAGRVALWGVALSWALRVLRRVAGQGGLSHTVPLTHEGVLGFYSTLRGGNDTAVERAAIKTPTLQLVCGV